MCLTETSLHLFGGGGGCWTRSNLANLCWVISHPETHTRTSIVRLLMSWIGEANITHKRTEQLSWIIREFTRFKPKQHRQLPVVWHVISTTQRLCQNTASIVWHKGALKNWQPFWNEQMLISTHVGGGILFTVLICDNLAQSNAYNPLENREIVLNLHDKHIYI